MELIINIEYDIEKNNSIVNLIKKLKESVKCELTVKSKTIKKSKLNINIISNIIREYYDLSEEIFLSKTREREVVQARQMAMYFSKKKTKSSLATIGAQIGGKDHATVLYACKTVNNLMDTDIHFKTQVKEIELIINNFAKIININNERRFAD